MRKDVHDRVETLGTTCTRNQWSALNLYVDDGDLSIDNNLAERTVKPVAIGRKPWLFVGSQKAGQRSTADNKNASPRANSSSAVRRARTD